MGTPVSRPPITNDQILPDSRTNRVPCHATHTLGSRPLASRNRAHCDDTSSDMPRRVIVVGYRDMRRPVRNVWPYAPMCHRRRSRAANDAVKH